MHIVKIFKTRKSSCRIPQQAYCPRHNLSKHILSQGEGTYLGWGEGGTGGTTLDGVPTLDRGLPTLDKGGTTSPILTWLGGVSYLGLGGTYLGQGGYLPWMWGTYLGVPPPHCHPDLAGGGTYLGRGVPTLGYPLPLWTDRLMPVKTLPSCRTTYAGGYEPCKCWLDKDAWQKAVNKA